MRISIIGPALPIPPKGWGAVESLIWDYKLTLNELGHEVQILNDHDPNKMMNDMHLFNPDFVHINYDDWILLYPYIKFPCACTTHFAYLTKGRLHMMGGYGPRVFKAFSQIKPVVFGLSPEINEAYRDVAEIPEEKLFLNPNGVMKKNFEFSESPAYPERSVYLAKIDHRKRQFLFQSIDSLWYAGNISEVGDYPPSYQYGVLQFDKSKNYLGEWEKDILYKNLTEYGNLVLLSDGEAHPLVCMEALAAGLGVVVSEWGTGNLDLSKKFITVIPEEKIEDTEYIEQQIIENREYSINNRQEIVDYAKQFEWSRIVSDYFLPNVEKVIEGELK